MVLSGRRLSVVPVDQHIVMIGTHESPFTLARAVEGLVRLSVCFLTLLLWKSKAGEAIREVHAKPCPNRPKASSRLVSVQLDRKQSKGQSKRNDKTFLTVQIEGQKNNINDKDRKKQSTEKHNQLCLYRFLSDECYWTCRAVCFALKTKQQDFYS